MSPAVSPGEPPIVPAALAQAILLHACCGPCSITPVLRLQDQGLAPTLYFYNPNIHPLTEYLRRREGLIAVAQRLNVPAILPDQLHPASSELGAADPAGWLQAMAALGSDMNDMARRCPLCYDLRLARAALAARERLDGQPDGAVVHDLAQFAVELLAGLGASGHGLLEDHLGLARARPQVVLPGHALQQHLQVQFAHAREDDLAGLRVAHHSQGRVFQQVALEHLVELVRLLDVARLDSE